MSKVWWLTNGPAHCKSTSWFDDILVDQLREAVFVGYPMQWIHRTILPCASNLWRPRVCRCLPSVRCSCVGDCALEPGLYRQHAIIAMSVQDQPAAAMATGRLTHTAAGACPFGSPCRGATLASSHRNCDTSHLESVIPKHGSFLPGEKTVTWNRLLEDWLLLQECSDHVPALSDILAHIRSVSALLQSS